MTQRNGIAGIVLLALATANGAVLAADNAGAPKAKPDILGITLGMTPEEVRAAFRATKLPFQLQDVRTTVEDLPKEPFIGSIYAQRQGGDSRQDRLLVNFSAPPNPLRVVMVTRLLDYGVDKGPLKLDLAKALESKYGAARIRKDHTVGIEMSWIKTPAGIPVLDKATRCPRPKYSIDPQGHIFFANLTIQDGCGLSVGAEVNGAYLKQPTLATDLWVAIVDYDDLWNQIQRTQAYIEQRVNDAAKARGTPQL